VAELVRADEPTSACARAVAEALGAIDAARGRARLAIPGGSAAACVGPIRRALGAAAWSRLALTWGDERCVPFDDPASNRGAAYRSGALDAAAPPALELALYLDEDPSPEAAAARAGDGFGAGFDGAIDVALLGLGPDGHVASLFPGHAALAAVGPVVAVRGAPKPPPERVTLAAPVLARARVFVLATGREKYAAIAGSAMGVLGRFPDVTLFTDSDFTSEVPR
jgi:6-phosphogluconolactonase